jgi:pimeloyl-ACP methyl ester carboxylesterase
MNHVAISHRSWQGFKSSWMLFGKIRWGHYEAIQRMPPSILHHEVFHSYASTIKTEPMIMLHGLFGNALNWKTLGQNLGELLSCSVYALDLRNHGRSFHHPEMDFPSMALDVKQWMETMNITSATVVGHSIVSDFHKKFLILCNIHYRKICYIGWKSSHDTLAI